MNRGFLQEKMGSYRVSPPASVWKGISGRLGGRNRRSVVLIVLAAAASLALALSLGIPYLSRELSSESDMAEATDARLEVQRDPVQERQAVLSLIEGLRERYPERFIRAILFGSKARGESQPWSDIDVLIIVDDDDWRFQHVISTLAARVSLEYDLVIGPRVISQERWERLKARQFSLYRNVTAEGIPLTPDLT